MMTPVSMAMLTMTVMLWILWSDTIRARRPSQILYTIRIGLFLVVSAMLILNLVRYGAQYSSGARALTIAAAAVGVIGAVYFGRRLVLRR
jgi:hypothetical protein